MMNHETDHGQVTRSKILALVIALGYLAAAVAMFGWDTKGAAVICLCLSLPLAFIWFPDEIEAFTAMVAKRPYGRITSETPATMVTIVGWLLLLGYLPLLAYLLH
jgi:hypothetical protein